MNQTSGPERTTENPTDRIARLAATLGPGLRKVAKVVAADPAEAAYMSGPTLARAAEVSEASVVRFAQSLGYEGYPDFLAALRAEVTRRTTVDRLRGSIEDEDDEVWRRVMAKDADNIVRTLERLDGDTFNRAVTALAEAPHIYVWGTRMLGGIAEFACTALTFLFGSERSIRLQPTLYWEQLIDVRATDVCIVLSVPRYFSQALKVADFAKARGCIVIAITDDVLSPVAEQSDYVFSAHSELLSFTESYAACLSLISAFITSLAVSTQHESMSRLQRLEQTWLDEGVYLEASPNGSFGP